MGDLMELTTWPKHLNVFYKITGDGIVFYVKGEKNAAIGLTKKWGCECDFWVLIGFNRQCWIKKNGRRPSCVSTPNILSNNKYSKFWITWNNGKISLGKNNESTPIISEHTSMYSLQYVTFSSLGERHPLYWKCYLPPRIENLPLIKVTGGEPRWVHADEQLPDDAFIGGFESGILYIIRAQHRGSLTPGKFVPKVGLGYICWGGGVHEKSDFEVLCGYDFTWVKTHRDEIPVGAVEGGYSEDGHEILYVGRILYEGELIPGKVQPSHNCCYIGFDDREIGSQIYEVLVSPSIKTRGVNNFYVSGLSNRSVMLNEYESDGYLEGADLDDDDDDSSNFG